MIIIELTYTAPIEEIDKYLVTHREFLETYYANGYFLASGPQEPRTGGIIIALTDDLDALKDIMSQDPFMMAQLAEYRYIKFTPVKHNPVIHELLTRG